MEAAAAARFLHPSTVVLSFAAVSPTLGDPQPPFHAKIHSLIATHNPQRPSSFETLASSLNIPFTPSETLTKHHGISLESISTVADLVENLVQRLTITPHALHTLSTLLEPHCDPALHGAYEPTSKVALFLRKVLVAFHSLTFFTHARLTDQLQTYLRTPPKQKDLDPSYIEYTRRSNPEAAQAALHKSHNNKHPHIAALQLIPFHASFNRSDNSTVAVHHALRAAHAATDEPAQKEALRWLAFVESPERRVRLLQHVDDPLARDREALLGLRPKGRYQALKVGSLTDRFVLQAAAWEIAGSVPTALAVARLAWRKVGKELTTADVRAGIAVADMMALQGDYDGAMEMLRVVKERLEAQATNEKKMEPELLLITRAKTWLELERRLRRRELNLVQDCVDHVLSYSEAAVNNTTLYSVDELAMDALEASARQHLLEEDALSARRAADELTRKAALVQRPVRAVEGMRLQAEAYLLAGSAIKALPIALRAVALADGLKLYGLLVTCTLTLVETMLEVEDDGYESRALAALLPVLPTAFEGLGIGTRARALRLYAECLIAADAEADRTPEGKSLDMLSDSMSSYESFEDIGGVRSCAYTLARVHDWRGDVAARDEAADRFQEVSNLITRRGWCYSHSLTR